MTQPVAADTNVTDEGAKLIGTGGRPAGLDAGVGEAVVAEGVGEGVGDGWDDGVAERPVTGVGFAVGCSLETIRFGTVTAAATITAAPPAATATCVSLRLRARFLIRSKVSGCGSNGFTRSLSQTSMSSRGSPMGFSQHGT